ncbi:neutral zinc metallopeptidase [Streptosporangium subroseum]|uniref:neutral zinc metallopeptidase n=1 Tax=Streptosporangium subroseum TaxID=106412 RepID=UPI0034395958
MIIALATAGGLLLTGTANAYPIKDASLTKNALYDSGKLATTKCVTPQLKNTSLPVARKYVMAVTNCLNASWGAHLTASDLPFGTPKLRFVSRIPKGYCDFSDVDTTANSQGYYCPQSRTIIMQIGTDWLEDADDLWLIHATGLLYGYHVQNLTGIEKAFQAAPYANKTELNEQYRRSSLQSDCLGGVFLRSVWSSLGASTAKWNGLAGLLKTSGDAKGEARVGGKGSSRAAWAKSGYTSGNPASCNTWAAPSAKVA